MSTECSRRCCSPTSSSRRGARRSSAIVPGATLLDAHEEIATPGGAALTAASSPTSPATVSWRRSTVRRARCAARCALRDHVHALGIEIRAGLHAGEIERRGGDVAGIGVHIAARVMALADADEVLVSRTVKDLVAGSGLEFEDRGTHELRGVPDAWQIFRADGSACSPPTGW